MPEKKVSQREIYRNMLDLQKGEDYRLNDDDLIKYYGVLGAMHVDLLAEDKSYRDTFNAYASQKMLEKETQYTTRMLSTHKEGTFKGTLKSLFYTAARLPTAAIQYQREQKLIDIALGPEPNPWLN